MTQKSFSELLSDTILWQGRFVRANWHQSKSRGVVAFLGMTGVWSAFWILLGTPTDIGLFVGGTIVSIIVVISAKVTTQQQQSQQSPQPSRQSQQPNQNESSQQQMQDEYVQQPPDIDFDDVAGNEELKDELKTKVIDPLNNPEKYDQYGLGIENGFLLYGPPGTGKTYTAKALAGELGLNWMPVKGSDVTSRYIGAGTENIANLFDEARENQPVLVFLDEIDALAPERGGANQHEDQTKQVNTLLEEISEIHDNDHDVVIVGATNRLDRIDDAMLRSGRLTEKIEVPPPDAEARLGVFVQHLDAPHEKLDGQKVIKATKGMTGADMEKVAKESARKAMERGGKVKTDDVLAAIDEIE
jgi:SpoVK/Ycf46/Vps4 family AAA+-type ATPase